MAGEHLSNVRIEVQDATTSPISYNTIENAAGDLQVGETNPLLDVTNFLDTSRRYIAGLADGDEFTITCFETHASPSTQQLLVARAQNKQNSTLRATFNNTSVSPVTTRVYIIEVTPTTYRTNPGVGEAAQLEFGFKISGGLQIS